MVGFPGLLRGSRDREDGECKSWFGEGGNYAICGFLNVSPKWGSVGGELVELCTPGGLEGGHGYGVGCFSLGSSDGFKWVCYPRIFCCLRRGVGVKLVCVPNVVIIPAVPLGFGIVSVESIN